MENKYQLLTRAEFKVNIHNFSATLVCMQQFDAEAFLHMHVYQR